MISANPITININPTNTPRVFHVEATWKRQFQSRFNVKYARFVCTEEVMILKLHIVSLKVICCKRDVVLVLQESNAWCVGFTKPVWAVTRLLFLYCFLNRKRYLSVESEIESVHKFYVPSMRTPNTDTFHHVTYMILQALILAAGYLVLVNIYMIEFLGTKWRTFPGVIPM